MASCLVDSEEYGIGIDTGENSWRLVISSVPLKPGSYIIGMNIADEKGSLIAIWYSGHMFKIKGGHLGIVPDCQLSMSEWHSL